MKTKSNRENRLKCFDYSYIISICILTKTGREREYREELSSHMKWGNSLEIRFFFIIEKLVFYISSVTIIHRKKKTPLISKVLIGLIASS